MQARKRLTGYALCSCTEPCINPAHHYVAWPPRASAALSRGRCCARRPAAPASIPALVLRHASRGDVTPSPDADWGFACSPCAAGPVATRPAACCGPEPGLTFNGRLLLKYSERHSGGAADLSAGDRTEGAPGCRARTRKRRLGVGEKGRSG
eukprot:362979-Chlamydomonas_euryale.AAC.3